MHEALDAFEQSRRGRRELADDANAAVLAFPARAVIRQKLSEVLDRETDNPRVDLDSLRARVDLDVCVSLFKRLVSRLVGRGASPRSMRNQSVQPKVRSGAEVWVDLDTPPLCGKLDLQNHGEIIEFKTGDPSPRHADQLQFYALLWWLKTGMLPEALELLYASPARSELVPVPTADDLTRLCEEVTAQIGQIESALADGAPLPKPDQELCSVCSVRQICDEYWRSQATEQLRGGDIAQLADVGIGQRFFRDVNLDRLPGSWSPGEPCVGTAHAIAFGDVKVRLDSSVCPKAGEQRPRTARLLGAKLTRTSFGWEVSNSRATEVFWLDGSLALQA